MNDKIKIIKTNISFSEVAEDMEEILHSGQLTKGPNVKKFTTALKEYTGCKHAFLTTSATTSLTLCLKSLNIKAGDNVAISDFSFPATANVVEDLGAKPVLVDVNSDTFNSEASEIEKLIWLVAACTRERD